MKLSQIKEKIVIYLKNLSVDDYYLDPSMSKAQEIFYQHSTCKTPEEIETYLTEAFPSTVVEKQIYNTTQTISQLQKEKKSLEKKLNELKLQNDKTKANLTDILNRQKALPELLKGEELKLEQYTKDLNAMKGLTNANYFQKEIKELEKKTSAIKADIDTYPIGMEHLMAKQKELELKTNEEQKSLEETNNSIQAMTNSLIEKEQELLNLQNASQTEYAKEFEALVFLFAVLLRKKAIKEEETVLAPVDPRTVKPGYVRVASKNDYIKTGKVDLKIYNLGFQNFHELVSGFLNHTQEVPKDWRRYLNQLLSQELPSFSGTLIKPDYYAERCIAEQEEELSSAHLAALMAIKIAVKSREAIRLKNKSIVLTLSGGMMAQINFRPRSHEAKQKQTEALILYFNAQRFKNSISEYTLYKQSGYADSTISISAANAYYILSPEYAIEIDFYAAPILFESGVAARFAPHIASKAKREDEIAKEQEDYDDWD